MGTIQRHAKTLDATPRSQEHQQLVTAMALEVASRCVEGALEDATRPLSVLGWGSAVDAVGLVSHFDTLGDNS